MDENLSNNLSSNKNEPNTPGSLVFNDKNISPSLPKNKIKKEKVVEKNKEATKVKKDKKTVLSVLTEVIPNPIWLSVSEAAKMGGVQKKTIRRAIQSKTLKYKIVSNRYLVDLSSVVIYLYSKTKLKNKLNQTGIGQYVKEWIE
jgi:excisionase family DNA binding protein